MLVELLKEIGPWLALLLLAGAVAAVDGLRRRRAAGPGRGVRYGPVDSHRPRSALWTGLLFAWIATSIAPVLLFAGLFPPRWRGAAIAAIVAATVLAAALALRFLLDYARTEVVEGRVVERRIRYGGEDDRIRSHWIAVDDGRRATITGTPVSPADYARVTPGARVRLHLTPRGRQVKWLEVVELPASVNGTPYGTAELWVSPERAALALGSPVEAVPVAPEVPNTRRYVYVPPGAKVTAGTALPPALHVTEAYDPEAADEVARRATAGGRRTWQHGRRGVFQAGTTYLLTWGRGALLIRGQVPAADLDAVGRLAHSLRPPAPGRD